MTKKYKLTEKYIIHNDVKLFQIQALVSFGKVSSGYLGGYIEKEENLSQAGDAWVSDNAKVYDNVIVSGDAWVYDNAIVYGDACVYGNAKVYGDACVSGNAWVYGDAIVSDDACVYGNAMVHGDALVRGDALVYGIDSIFLASCVGTENGTLTVTSGKNGLVVTRGCFTGTKEEFLSASAAKHNERIQREYRLLIEVAESRIGQHKELSVETTA